MRGLAFAWNVCGDYVCYLKAQALNREQNAGRPSKAVAVQRLCDAVGAGARRRAAEQDGAAEEERDEPSVEELDCCV